MKSRILVYSKDAFLSPSIANDRLLSAGGEFLFTVPMAVTGVNSDEFSEVLARLILCSLGHYKQLATDAGFNTVEFENLTEYLP